MAEGKFVKSKGYRVQGTEELNPKPQPPNPKPSAYDLRMIAWEVTRACNLKCVHCRAAAVDTPPPGEFSTEEAFQLLDQIAEFSRPVIILTGGEPLLREDIFDIAEYGIGRGLRVVMAPNGTLITAHVARQMKNLGIPRVSISLDGSNSEIHDRFRQVPGAFDGAVQGIGYLKEAGVSFQINTTVTKRNLEDLPRILDTVRKLEADAWHVFLLVPTGRGKEMEADEISPDDYEKTLNWLFDKQRELGLFIKATCAPHYYRIFKQRVKRPSAPEGFLPKGPVAAQGGLSQRDLWRAEGEGVPFKMPTQGLEAMTRGCLGGITFCFISHMGEVYPCGYLEVLAGNVREQPFEQVWRESRLFGELRDFSKLKGKCGICEYKKICGGCRARAHARTGDYLAEEPYCVYQPKTGKG